jgi:hypothetical protein
MKILTLDDTSYDLDTIPEEIDDIRYCVVDYSDPENVDYIYVPLVFLESFNAPAAVIEVGGHTIQMPLDWSIVIGEKDIGDLEVLPIMNFNDRHFNAFVYNPTKSIMAEFLPIKIVNIYSEMKWYFPKLKYGHILSVPLTDTKNPNCIFIVKEINKIPEVLDITQLWL